MSNNQKFILRLILAGAAIAAFLYILPKISGIIIIIVLAILFYTILDPLVDRLERFNLSRALSTLLTLLVIFLVIGSGISALIPIFNDAWKTTSDALGGESITQQIEKFSTVVNDNISFITIPEDTNEKVMSFISDFIKSDLPGFLLDVSKIIGSVLSNLFFVIFTTFFLLKDERRIKKAIIRLVPNRHFELSLNLMYKIQAQLASYLQGQFIAAMSVGVLSTIGLLLLNLFLHAGISYAVVIGVWAGLANLIPYVGPIAGAVPAILIVIFNGAPNVLVIIVSIIIMFMLVQMIDNIFVSPLVVGKSVDMHPLTVFLVLLIGGNVMGLLGMMFAVPVAGIIKVTSSEILNSAGKYKV